MFQQLVQKLHSSHLHFHLSETPFSAQILIRKKFIKDMMVPSITASDSQSKEITNLNNQILELQKKVEIFSDTIDILEKKLDEAESKAMKTYQEKEIESETLRNSLKNSDFVASNLKKDLQVQQKVVKENLKLIQKLELKNENLAVNNKNIKAELNKVKNENKKLLRNKTQQSKASETQKSDLIEDANHNMLLSESSRPLPNSPGVADPSRTSLATPTCPSPSRTPPGTPPNASSCSTATVGSEGSCSHSPQCTTRQPRPPPPNKCTILVHTGSGYHEHMASQPGVPHQLGDTHEYCMRVDYVNYGCEQCKWFKRWGELHGFPDINS